MARPCIVAPVFVTAKVTLPALTGSVGLDPHVAERRVDVGLRGARRARRGAAPASGPATFGAPVVCRMPAAPLTMSPNAWVTNG